MSALAQALLEVQKNAPVIQKDGLNPHFKSKYVSLDTLMPTILPVLNKHGVVLLQEPTSHNGQPALRTKLIHAESGEMVETTMLLVLAKEDPQGQGSALTYARRYALMAMLGLVADEDDDGNKATRSQTTSHAESRNGKTKPELLAYLSDILVALKTQSPGTDWTERARSFSKEHYETVKSTELTKPQLQSLVNEAEKWLAHLEAEEVPFG